jgi:hypothetical protein
MTLEYKRLRPHQLGWLLRSDLESNHSEVWQKPDGSLYYRKKTDWINYTKPADIISIPLRDEE